MALERIEEFLDIQYGDSSPRNYNKNLSIVKDFFKFQIMRGQLHGDPTLPIERARARQVYRTTFTTDQRRAILAEAEDLRDRIALRLLLDYGLRKGALKAIQFKHFDHQRKRLTIFTKGQKVREMPIPHPAFWMDLERHLLDAQAGPNHYLMCRQKTVPRAGVVRFADKPMGDHGLHDWWYKRLAEAGIVAQGTTSGERMHKARHTAGQRVLDATRQPEGGPKAAGALVDSDDRRRVRRLGYRPARRDDGRRSERGGRVSLQIVPTVESETPRVSRAFLEEVETAGIEPASAVA